MTHRIAGLCFDIDGTLTDATTWWGGPQLGWLQRYSVRDGEALLRLQKRGLAVIPLSRNKTKSAMQRMTNLGLPTRWTGVSDKIAAMEEICSVYELSESALCHIGDGPDDAIVFERVGLGVAVADAHPRAKSSADLVLEQAGGERAIEGLELTLEEKQWL